MSNEIINISTKVEAFYSSSSNELVRISAYYETSNDLICAIIEVEVCCYSTYSVISTESED